MNRLQKPQGEFARTLFQFGEDQPVIRLTDGD
jgi:hypothetical protein